MEDALTFVQPIIHDFVKKEFEQCDEEAKKIDQRSNDKTMLDVFFRKTIEKYG